MENNRIPANLKSNNQEVVIQTIEEIAETGSPAHFSLLLELLHHTKNKIVKNKIIALFSELKSTETIPLLMDAIQNEKFEPELKELLSCCWQNGLNYSPWLPYFVDLVITREFSIAFEAFTIIENMYGKIDESIINKQIEKINTSLEKASEQKKYFLSSLLSIIPEIPEEREN